MGLKKKQIQMLLEQHPELSIRQIREYWSAFEMFLHEDSKLDALGNDREEEEAITIDILGGIMRRMFQNPTERELLDMVREVDEDGSGNIEFNEFVALMASSNKKLDSKFEMNEAFRVFDQDSDGTITRDELRRVFKSLGCSLTEEECEMMIREVDKTGTGAIHQEDFVRLMSMSQRDVMKMNEKKTHIRALMLKQT